jgi:hypothetical protein
MKIKTVDTPNPIDEFYHPTGKYLPHIATWKSESFFKVFIHKFTNSNHYFSDIAPASLAFSVEKSFFMSSASAT